MSVLLDLGHRVRAKGSRSAKPEHARTSVLRFVSPRQHSRRLRVIRVLSQSVQTVGRQSRIAFAAFPGRVLFIPRLERSLGSA